MIPEEKIEAAQKLIDEARAELAAKKRNWPEKIEPGMLFRHRGGAVYVWPHDRCQDLVCLVAGGESRCGDAFYKDMARACMDSFTYLGHARDLIKIADDAREPTGAELVGKLCEFSDDGKAWTKPGECDKFDPSDREMAYHSAVKLTLAGDDRKWFEFARLAR